MTIPADKTDLIADGSAAPAGSGDTVTSAGRRRLGRDGRHCGHGWSPRTATVAARVEALLADMTVAEKAGQLTQYFYFKLADRLGGDRGDAADRLLPAAGDGRGGAGARAASGPCCS